MASAGGERMSTTDFKRKRELDEARKNGTLPPEQDADGNLINPHNPEYISKRPWYLGDSGPSLKHQSLQNKAQLLSLHEADELHVRGRRAAGARGAATATAAAPAKWRKGACKNCGAQSHQTRECVERPRKVGAWKTNRDIKSDEVLVDVRSQQFGRLAFDAKRDQWLGYDPKDHAKTIARYDKIDEARKKLRMEAVDKKLQEAAPAADSSNRKRSKKREPSGADGAAAGGSESESDSDSDSDSDDESEEDEEFRDHDEGPMFTDRVARQGGVGGAQMKTTVRNLRIREDTAKYLRNLNPNSAYYDPKTRSMRDNPNPELHPEDTTFAGDNVVRFTGDAQRLASAQLFAWEAYAKGTDIHPLANPSQAEILKTQFEAKKAALEREKARKILDKYGGQAHLEAPSKELLLAQSEHYVEYARDGRVVKGLERAPVRSKYVEDARENNHTAVWGSWFDRAEHAWGYACCHAKVRKSYCTGEDGKRAVEDAAAVAMKTEREEKVEDNEGQQTKHKTKVETTTKTASGGGESGIRKRSDMYGENVAPALDDRKLRKALRKAKKAQAKADAETTRKYNSMGSYEVDAEEMEAYKLLRSRGDDPMAKLLGKGEDALLE